MRCGRGRETGAGGRGQGPEDRGRGGAGARGRGAISRCAGFGRGRWCTRRAMAAIAHAIVDRLGGQAPIDHSSSFFSRRALVACEESASPERMRGPRDGQRSTSRSAPTAAKGVPRVRRRSPPGQSRFRFSRACHRIEAGVDAHSGDAGARFAVGGWPIEWVSPRYLGNSDACTLTISERGQVDHGLRNDLAGTYHHMASGWSRAEFDVFRPRPQRAPAWRTARPGARASFTGGGEGCVVRGRVAGRAGSPLPAPG